MKKKVFLIILAIILLGGLGLFYLNTVFLPKQFKQIIVTKAEDFLGRKVSLKEIEYNLLKGIVLRSITVSQKDSPDPFLQAEEISASIILPNLFKGGKIIIPSLTIKKPSVYITRLNDRTWNFSDLLAKISPTSGGSNAPPFLLGGLSVDQAKIELTDQTIEPASTDILEVSKCRLNFSLTQGVQFTAQARIPRESSLITLQGSYFPVTQAFSSTISAQNFHISKYLSLFYTNPAFDLKDAFIEKAQVKLASQKEQLNIKGDLTAQINLFLVPERSIRGQVTVTNLALTKQSDAIDASALVDIKEAVLILDKEKEFLGNLSVKDLKVSLNNENIDVNADITLENLLCRLGNDKKITGTLLAHNFYFHRHGQDFNVTGQLEMPQAALQIDPAMAFSGNIATFPLTISFKDQKTELKASLQLENAQASLGKDKTLTGSFSVQGLVLTVAGNETKLKTHIETRQTKLSLPDAKEFSGEPQAEVEISYDPARQQPIVYAGSLTFNEGSLKGFFPVGEITGIKGKLSLENDSLTTDSLSLVLFNTQILAQGSLKDFQHPRANFQVSANAVDLITLSPFWGPTLKKWKITPTGEADIIFSYDGPVPPTSDAKKEAVVHLRKASLEGEKLGGKISDISGILKYAPDMLSWENLKGTYQSVPYTLNGSVANFSRPLMETQVTAPEVDLNAKVKILNNAFTISSLSGKFLGTTIENFEGDINVKESGDADLDLRGRMNLNLSTLARLGPIVAEKIKTLHPSGSVALEIFYKGGIKNWKSAAVIASLTSGWISLANYQFQDVSLKLEHGDKEFSTLNILAMFYGGKLSLSLLADFNKEDIPFKLSAQVENTDLSLLKKDTALKEKDISGSFSFLLNAEGPFSKPENIQGQGNLAIKEGHIWKFNLLEGIWKSLLIPEYEEIVFTDATADLTIQNKRLGTDNLLMTGQAADLLGQGWIDFDKNINFNITPKFKETELVLAKDSLKKGPSAILAGTEGYLNIKISGTLDQPTYSVVTVPTKIIERATDVLKEGLGGILEEIFR